MNFKCCYKSHVVCINPWAFSPISLFCVDSWQVWQEHRTFLIYGIRSVSSETSHRSLFLEREKLRLNRTGNAVMKEWKYFHYQSICMSTADREWCETFPEGLPKIFPCAIDRLAEPRLNEQCHNAFCIKKCDIQALYLVNICTFLNPCDFHYTAFNSSPFSSNSSNVSSSRGGNIILSSTLQHTDISSIVNALKY